MSSFEAEACLEEYGLTPREGEVAGLILRGCDGVAVHGVLGISYNTVKTHLKHIYEKCGVSSKRELVYLAYGVQP